MTPEQLRETLGLPADASDIQVGAKLAALMQTAPPVTDPVVPPVIEPVAPVVEPVAVEPVKDDISDHPIVKELRESLRQVTEEREAEKVAAKAKERDEFLGNAIRAGRLKPADRERFAKLYDAAPDITKETVLARGVGSEIPVTTIGHSDSPDGFGENADFENAIPDPGKGF